MTNAVGKKNVYKNNNENNDVGRKIVVVFLGLFGFLFVSVTLAPVFQFLGLEFLSKPIYFIGGFLCHQMYTRSVHLFDYQVAVCARDQFMYLAMALSAFLALRGKIKKIPFWMVIVLLLPAALDGGSQFIASLGIVSDFSYQSTVLLRAVTGTLFGAGVGFYVFPMMLED